MDKQAIEDRIRNGEIEAALQLLMESLAEMPAASALYQEALALSAALKDGQRQVARGIIDPTHYQAIRSRAVAGIQEIVEQAKAPQLYAPITSKRSGSLKGWIAAVALLSIALLWGVSRLFVPPQQKPNKEVSSTQQVQPQPSEPADAMPTRNAISAPPQASSQSQNPPSRKPTPQPDQSAPAPSAVTATTEVEIWLSAIDCRLKVNGLEPDVTAGHNTQKRKLRLPVGAAEFTVICGAKACQFTRHITLGMPRLYLSCQ